MNTPSTNNSWRVTRNVLIVGVSVLVISALFRLTEAGSLDPIAVPASSSESLEKIYDALTSDSYDSSGITPSKNGSALQVTKCIIEKITGGTPCP